MSRMATSEYIGARRRMYAESSPGKRGRILDEVCETTGYRGLDRSNCQTEVNPP